MAERRSGRLRKCINYARFGGEEEDDDDFQISKTQEKRSKISHEKSDKKKASSNSNSSSQSSSKSFLESEKPCKRPSLDDKIFQRQLKVVLERSIDETDPAVDKKLLKNTADTVGENTIFRCEQKRASPSNYSSVGSRILKEIPRISPSKTADDCTELIAEDQEQDLEDIPQRPPAVALSLTPQTNVKRAKCTSSRNSSVPNGPDISLITPVKKSSISLLSYKGLKLGLSRKVPMKPLHTGVIKLT